MVRTCQGWEHSYAQLWGTMGPPTVGNLGGGGVQEKIDSGIYRALKAWIESKLPSVLGSGTPSVSKGTIQGLFLSAQKHPEAPRYSRAP